MTDTHSLLTACLFYTSNRLARQMTKMADQLFKETGLPASYVYMLITINDFPGINHTTLSDKLSIAPSTSSRFAEKLIQKELVEKEHAWKEVRLSPTTKGKALVAQLLPQMRQLEADYRAVIGEAESTQLVQALNQASDALKKKGY